MLYRNKSMRKCCFIVTGMELNLSLYPFPKVGSPSSTARLLSFNAPAKISLALAVPLFTWKEFQWREQKAGKNYQVLVVRNLKDEVLVMKDLNFHYPEASSKTFKTQQSL